MAKGAETKASPFSWSSRRARYLPASGWRENW